MDIQVLRASVFCISEKHTTQNLIRSKLLILFAGCPTYMTPAILL